MRQPKIIVVGGGLAGLMATIRVAEAGIPVELFSIVPVKRSHSVCAQGGINAAKNQKGEGDTIDKHFDDTIYGGDFLANQPLVKRMCDAAPGIIDLLDRMGVMFNRTPEGLLDYRRFGGTLYHRTAFAGATTGQQLLYALDEQVRRHEAAGLVRKHETWELCSLIMDDAGRCRGIFKVVFEMKLGVDGQPMVYLDVSHLDPDMLERKVGGVLEIYRKFVGEDPTRVPMRIFPGMHYSMGGLWVDYKQRTSVPGLFAAGEVDHQYHGANRLGANSLLSCLYSGQVAGPAMVEYVRGSTAAEANGLAEREAARQSTEYERIGKLDGPENAYELAREMGEWMTANVTVIRYNKKLVETDDALHALKDRWGRIGLSDRGRWANHEITFVNQLWNMLELARVITLGAARRDESRGAHYKPAFPQRDDKNWLKTTRARWTS